MTIKEQWDNVSKPLKSSRNYDRYQDMYYIGFNDGISNAFKSLVASTEDGNINKAKLEPLIDALLHEIDLKLKHPK